MGFGPAPERTIRAFERALAGIDEAEPRRMFGYACRFVRGHLFAGTHELGMILRLSEADRAEFLRTYDAKLFDPMNGRPMREYVVVPEALELDAAALRGWVERGLVTALARPEKKAPAKKSAAKKSPAKKSPAKKSPAKKPPKKKALSER